MNRSEFEALVDDFGESAKQLVDLVEQARYEQPTARAIAQLLDAREQLLTLIAKVPALRASEPPESAAGTLAARPDLATRIEQARTGLAASPDPTAIHALVTEAAARFAATVAPMQAAGRWPKNRSR